MKAFEKSCRLLEEYQKASEDKTQDDPKEKESVLSKLKAYEEEAKHRLLASGEINHSETGENSQFQSDRKSQYTSFSFL